MRIGYFPVLTCLTFLTGTGLGLAWKTGHLPIELSLPRTGHLAPDALKEEGDSTLERAPADSSMSDAPISKVEPKRRRLPPLPTEIPSTGNSENQPARSESGGSDAIEFLDETTVAKPTTPPRVIPSDDDDWATAPLPDPKRRTNSVRPAVASDGDRSPAEATVKPTSLDNQDDLGEAPPSRSVPLTTGSSKSLQNENESPLSEEAPLPRRTIASKDGTTSSGKRAVDVADLPFAADLVEIDQQIAAGETLAAHKALSKLYWDHREHRQALMSRLEATSRAIFFQPQPHFIEPHVIEPNEQLRQVASKYKLTWEYLAKLNKIDPRRIQSGQKVKVLKGPFSAVVDLDDFTLTVHLSGYFVKRYQIGIGKDGSTPLGKFTVLNKVENPQYTGPDGKVIAANDPANPLGERWLDLGDSYGIHGTIDPNSIGKAASRGCIRMHDADVIEVYNFLIKNSEVSIRH